MARSPVRVLYDVPADEAERYPLLEHTEENLVALGVDPAKARFMMRVSRGEIPGDEVDTSKRRR